MGEEKKVKLVEKTDCNKQQIGLCSEADGCNTISLGDCSHAEGCCTKAKGTCSHSEGCCTHANGNCSHSEGRGVVVNGNLQKTKAVGQGSHAEGAGTLATGEYSHAEGGNTFAGGSFSHAEGSGTKATSFTSHSEGCDTQATGECSHAEGDQTTASSKGSHAEGIQTNASGLCSHAEGNQCSASGLYSHAEGDQTIASGFGSHSEGFQTIASNTNSHAEGEQTIASGFISHAEGSCTESSGTFSHAEGNTTSTAGFEGAHIMGKFGDACDNYSWFMAGGISSGNKAITACIKNNGDAFFNSVDTVNPCCTDYAEMFETIDSKAIDVGYFVTCVGDKIRKATSEDSYILGVTSATPAITCGTAETCWQCKYLKDEWGRTIYEAGKPILNPEYDSNQKYISRKVRVEWVAVGLLGQLLVRDDGSCQVNGYCRPNDNGVATNSDEGYRVLRRTGENQILVLYSIMPFTRDTKPKKH